MMLYNAQLLRYIGENGVAAFGVVGYVQELFTLTTHALQIYSLSFLICFCLSIFRYCCNFCPEYVIFLGQ